MKLLNEMTLDELRHEVNTDALALAHELIQVAYEISHCNEEGYTDADEAMRIWEDDPANYGHEKGAKVGALAARIFCDLFAREFPEGRRQ